MTMLETVEEMESEWGVNYFGINKDNPYIFMRRKGHYTGDASVYIRQLPKNSGKFYIRDYDYPNTKYGVLVAGPFPDLDSAKAAFILLYGRSNK
jgi:hypothetical protein